MTTTTSCSPTEMFVCSSIEINVGFGLFVFSFCSLRFAYGRSDMRQLSGGIQ
jgi:hypothetical protein